MRTDSIASPDVGENRPSVIVVGLDTSPGLQTSRLLARRGVRIVGIRADARHPATRTNTCSRVVDAPTEGQGLLRTLESLQESEPGAVLIPCTDAAVATLAQARDRITNFRHALPAADVVDELMDKQRFAALMERHGIPVPRSIQVDGDEAARKVANELSFPCVVKPALKTARWEAAGPKVYRFETAAEWLGAAPRLLGLHPTLVVQEWLEGGDDTLYSCNCYIAPRGMPIVTFVARKLRQWPPSTGSSCLGEAVLDDGIRDLALQVLSCVDFTGLGYVEIKRSPVDGVDRVIEANVGRPTGRSAIAEAGGVELLYTMYCDIVRAPLPVDRVQRDRPVKWIHLRRDTLSSLHYLRAGELTLPQWAKSLRGPKAFADADLSDPMPFVGDVARDIVKVSRRILTSRADAR